MLNSQRLIADACAGTRPEHTPIFDLLLNDAVIEHFAGRPLDGTDDEAVSIAAVGNALDGSRHIAVPDVAGRTWTDEQGNVFVAARWTNWIQKHALTTTEQWVAWIARHIDQLEASPAPAEAERERELKRQQTLNARLNGTAYIHCTPSTAINDLLFGRHCGLEIFSYLWTDQRALMLRWLRALEDEQQRYIERAARR